MIYHTLEDMQGRPPLAVLPLDCVQGTQRVFGKGEYALTLQTHVDGFIIYRTSACECAFSLTPIRVVNEWETGERLARLALPLLSSSGL